jgi:hypothetical protein
MAEIDLEPGFEPSLEPLHFPTNIERRERRRERQRELDTMGSTFYGPCSRCEHHWTRKVDENTPGICRACLGELKGRLEKFTA